MNVIIVDDEPLALDVLETYISRMPDLHLVARCNDAFEANEALKNHKVDLMFLDIQMPQLTGIEFLKSLTRPPMVVFTTAYSEYAVEGFELSAIDYLMKPISMDRFMKSVNKAREQFDQKNGETEKTTPETHAPEGELVDYIFVKADKKLMRVRFSEIMYVEGLKDYVIIKLETQRIICLQTMKSLEDKLPMQKFVRIHRSFIVAIDKIQAIVGNSVEVTEKGIAKHLPIGKNYRDELLEMIEKHKI
ncbi:MAG: hypothetical protein RL757_3160 [Bacteroidota bacterium]|jgi:DNA-binding LytR/AlgR family response regulator